MCYERSYVLATTYSRCATFLTRKKICSILPLQFETVVKKKLEVWGRATMCCDDLKATRICAQEIILTKCTPCKKQEPNNIATSSSFHWPTCNIKESFLTVYAHERILVTAVVSKGHILFCLVYLYFSTTFAQKPLRQNQAQICWEWGAPRLTYWKPCPHNGSMLTSRGIAHGKDNIIWSARWVAESWISPA